MDQNSNEKNKEDMNKESTISILTTLAQRHEDAAQKYREAAAIVSDEELNDYLESLADYRQELYEEAREWLESMPPSPVPASKRIRSYLHEHWGDFREVLLLNNRPKITDFCNKSETAISDYYRESLAQSGIPVSINEELEKQHQHILEVKRKVERMETVPTMRNSSF